MCHKFFTMAVLCVLLLAGCSEPQNVPAVESTQVNISTEPTDTITTSANFELETALISEAYHAITDIVEFSTDNPHLPCKNIYVTVDEDSLPINTLFVTLWDDRELAFPLPVTQNSYLDLNSVDFANLDEDAEQEIIVSCWFGFFYMGIYVLDITTESLLPVPTLTPTDDLPGVDYEVTNDSYKTMTIKNDLTGFSEEVALEEILTSRYAEIKPHVDFSENDYKKAYTADSCHVSYWNGYCSIETIDEQDCLVLQQVINGAWGKNDTIGFVETSMRWDENGEYVLLESRFVYP